MPLNLDNTGLSVPGQDDRTPGGAPSPGYETRDANTRAILFFLVALLVALLLTLFAVRGLFRYFAVALREPGAASSFAEVRQLPAGPELKVNPRKDLIEIQDSQLQVLETYAWEDRKAGIVRVPIDRAMELLLQKGLPVLPLDKGQDTSSDTSASQKAGGVSAVMSAGTPGSKDNN